MRGPMQKSQSVNSSWQSVLASPPRASHILQIYDSDDFLASAVAHFAAAGLQAEEAVLLSGTKDHLGRIERKLRAAGVDAPGAERTGQLMLSDVHESLVHVVPNGRLEPARFTGVRWWSELTNTLHHAGNPEAGLQAEKLADAAARKYGATLFCSFLCDKFEARGYDDVLRDLCCLHSHVIPAEDYVQHRLAVNRAIADVLGDIRGTLLQSLTSWKGLTCDLPSSQALLFWVREALPDHFDAVLERARIYQNPS
jgi:MEDS: MEthanogen/methylotroph, DcmR Sensory domain